MAPIDYDNWTAVADDFQTNTNIPLTVVCFAHKWSPTATFMSRVVQNMKTSPDFRFAKFFIIDAQEEPEAAYQHGVLTTPSIVIYLRGSPLTIRRPEYKDDIKVVGSIPPVKFEELLHVARMEVDSGKTMPILHLEC
eukprot:TRINITY_DN34320_c0_g1_i1.p1 TRINITY_DN34320_c0_g1~~TRINITY_DN34320_c0_g1_i1.p1  ORF type:complete len:137 (+),score=15.66 TRINITY_DN34320_c0_g1_i1:224-634(+)